jgi:hypothetical protein
LLISTTTTTKTTATTTTMIISFMQDIYTYKPETNHVSTEHSFTDTL